jgi:hypothetical protein
VTAASSVDRVPHARRRHYEHSGRLTVNSINFITCHDGFTPRDVVSYNHKHNDANGEGNRDGNDQNDSWNCGVEGETDDPEVESLRRRQIKNFAALLLLSQGVPMITAGDEIRRTQHGNNNAYCRTASRLVRLVAGGEGSRAPAVLQGDDQLRRETGALHRVGSCAVGQRARLATSSGTAATSPVGLRRPLVGRARHDHRQHGRPRPTCISSEHGRPGARLEVPPVNGRTWFRRRSPAPPTSATPVRRSVAGTSIGGRA